MKSNNRNESDKKENKRINSYHIIWIIIAALVLIYFFTGTQGKAVLIGTSMFGISVIMMGALIWWLLIIGIKKKDYNKLILLFILGTFLVGYGFITEINVFRDINSGVHTIELNNCYITSRGGRHGIIGFRYYINGVDNHGKKVSFPISIFSRDELDGTSKVKVKYYKNIDRIVEWE